MNRKPTPPRLTVEEAVFLRGMLTRDIEFMRFASARAPEADLAPAIELEVRLLHRCQRYRECLEKWLGLVEKV